MSTCPACGYTKNIDGADVCEKCQSPLIDLTKPRADSGIERSIHKDRIRSLAPRTPYVVTPNTPVADVLREMVQRKLGCVVVVFCEQVVGIFSERDALLRLNAEATALGDRPISEFMTPHPETLELDDKIAWALHKMDLGGYRHIPIVDEGRPVGMISIRDILRYVTDHVLAEV
jgi:CBS domain-containing protein